MQEPMEHTITNFLIINFKPHHNKTHLNKTPRTYQTILTKKTPSKFITYHELPTIYHSYKPMHPSMPTISESIKAWKHLESIKLQP